MGAIVDTAAGRVKGAEEEGLQVFRGLPYAKSPRGELRFCAPLALEPWAGVRDASGFGPSAPQNSMLLPLPGMDVGETDEDCLHLNVWTPRADDGGRPVLFWIHGGAFVIGSGSQSVYDGAALARRGDAVVVTINYRLGPLGFLYLKDLCPDLPGATGNAGIRDQIAALEWVHDNIAGFGGDPDNVTIFGESAGGMSVGTLLGVPAARGLFRRAIAQSGASHNFHTRESATQAAETFLETLGVSPGDAAGQLPQIPASKLLDIQRQIFFRLSSTFGLLPFQPLVDDDVLPAPALDAIRAGNAEGVDVLVGSTCDEWKLFGMFDPDARTADAETIVEKLGGRIPGVDVAALLATYARAREGRLPTDPASLFFAIETDRIFRLPAIRLAEAQRTHGEKLYMYRMDWCSPALEGRLGACHAIELPFVFGTYAMPGAELFVGKGAEVRALADQMMDAWLGFARSGDPGHSGLPNWPRYELDGRETMTFGAESSLLSDPDSAERLVWEGLI